MLCGQHALNNLLQEPIFSPVDLSEIAQDLDAQERKFMMESGSSTPDAIKFMNEQSGNVDNSGNFSIQVLRAAIQRSNQINLVSLLADKGLQNQDVSTEQGFIVNRSAHWFTIRKINKTWWNLNSTLELPEVITEFYLSAFLNQLVGDGYTVFAAKGKLPTAGKKPFEARSSERSKWYTEHELMTKGGKTIEAFPGEGRRLTEKKASMIGGSSSSNNDNDDPELAFAIALSQAEGNSNSSIGNYGTSSNGGISNEQIEKNEMKRRRLEALNRRGL